MDLAFLFRPGFGPTFSFLGPDPMLPHLPLAIAKEECPPYLYNANANNMHARNPKVLFARSSIHP